MSSNADEALHREISALADCWASYAAHLSRALRTRDEETIMRCLQDLLLIASGDEAVQLEVPVQGLEAEPYHRQAKRSARILLVELDLAGQRHGAQLGFLARLKRAREAWERN